MNELATGPMLEILESVLSRLEVVDTQLWSSYGYGIDPRYTQYGLPTNLTAIRAFMLLEAYHEEIKRKLHALDLLVKGTAAVEKSLGNAVLAAMEALGAEIEKL